MKDACPGCGNPRDYRARRCMSCREYGGGKGVPRPAMRGPRQDTGAVVARALATATTTDEGCLLVTAWRPQPKGYVRGPRVDERGAQMLHRLVVEHHLGRRLERDDSVDHRCHNLAAEAGVCAGGPTCLHRRCVNIAHLEVVTAVENWERGTLGVVRQRREMTHCRHGHPFAGRNLRIRPGDGARECLACQRARAAGRDPSVEPAVV